MDDKNIKEETLQEMEARLTMPVEYEVHPILSHSEEVKANQKLEKEIEELRAKLPVYRGEVEIRTEGTVKNHKESLNLTDDEYSRLNNTKWIFRDTGKRAYGLSIDDILQLSEEGFIEKVEETSETPKQMEERFLREAVVVENQSVTLPSWF